MPCGGRKFSLFTSPQCRLYVNPFGMIEPTICVENRKPLNLLLGVVVVGGGGGRMQPCKLHVYSYIAVH